MEGEMKNELLRKDEVKLLFVAKGSHSGDWQRPKESRFYSTVLEELPSTDDYYVEEGEALPLSNLLTVVEKSHLDTANARIAELEKQIEKAEKVVEFYGAKENWRDEADSGVKVFGPFKDHKTWTDCGYEYDWENLHDQGEKAREYFADKEKK